MHQQHLSIPGNSANMLSNATIRHCSRLAGRDCVELPDPATDGPGKCRGMPRGIRPSDGAAHLAADKYIFPTNFGKTQTRLLRGPTLASSVGIAAGAAIWMSG